MTHWSHESISDLDRSARYYSHSQETASFIPSVYIRFSTPIITMILNLGTLFYRFVYYIKLLLLQGNLHVLIYRYNL